MKFNWLPWKFLIKIVARRHGFLDPIVLLSHLKKFSQPSEVAEPIELLRAGVLFHARGLINSRVIQHNLDWVWPYWVERQFDPTDISFVPRAFSITHVNLTHRNWTAVGVPGFPQLPIIDPRGLVTPHFDKWSIDAWVVTHEGSELLPSRCKNTQQELDYKDGVTVVTRSIANDIRLQTKANVRWKDHELSCNLNVSADVKEPSMLIIALRPYNPEGVAFINDIEISENRQTWTIDKHYQIHFNQPCDHHHVSTYHQGDVHIHLKHKKNDQAGHCNIGLVTAAGVFEIKQNSHRNINIQIPLSSGGNITDQYSADSEQHNAWTDSLANKCRLSHPDKKIEYLYETSIRTLVLCSPNETFPGPYTYKRFWYRDAAFITCGLLYAGLSERAEKSLQYFPVHQNHKGYFHSQEGEWDANGEALWILRRFYECTGKLPDNIDWWPVIRKAGSWIENKRTDNSDNSPHAGLLPAGFSAEHLGPNDYYYWDDYWSVAGLKAAAFFADHFGHEKYHVAFDQQAKDLMSCIEKSLEKVRHRLSKSIIPASPYRRMDAGAIGSLAASYPLQLYSANHAAMANTVEFILQHCMVNNGFFQDMIHSGVNPYLTLHIAQVLLRAGDVRFSTLIEQVAQLASPTGQWPEAIHSHTLGGCMGDGQHAWAAAEWVIMIRNCFVREENDILVIGSGISETWINNGEELSFGFAPTTFGDIYIQLHRDRNIINISWDIHWRRQPKKIEIRLPGLPFAECTSHQRNIAVKVN